jgi:hypothetical protein
MPDINLAALQERHLAAVRWESIRAAFFMRAGKHDNATRCKLLVRHHMNAARDAEAGLKKNARK